MASTSVVRVGAHVDQADPVGEAQARGANAAQIFLGNPQDWKAPTVRYPGGAEALLSAAAGGDGAIARKLDVVGRLWDVVGDLGLGFCLDTCHAFSAGLDLSDVVEKVLAITGRIDLVHANDSRDPFDSGADRHANVGEGTIGIEAVGDVVRAAGVTTILETPGAKSGKSDDVEILRAYLTTSS